MLKREPAEQPMAVDIRAGEGWRIIGNVAFFDLQWIHRCAEIGILIGDKTQWNKGYGTETMRLMLKYGFETLNLNRIYLRVYRDNLGGIKAYERAGFVHEGVQRQAIFSEGHYTDVLMMSVLRDEYLAK
jgi:RimJ/RimL family protein N-acetyltransferase